MRLSILFILLVFLAPVGLCFEGPDLDEELYFHKHRRSQIDWKSIDPFLWTDYKSWKKDLDRGRSFDGATSGTASRQSDEKVGMILDCVGECRVYRGIGYARGQFRSSLLEGDEVYTVGDSYAWLFLMDGTLVRLSPSSSVTLREINISKDSTFLHARVNGGNVLWLGRSEATFQSNNLRETDTLFLPLPLSEANIDLPKKKVKEDNLFALLEEDPLYVTRYKKLNELVERNNQFTQGKPTRTILVFPNGTLVGEQLQAELVVLIGGKSFVRKRSGAKQFYGKKWKDKNLDFYHRGFEKRVPVRLNNDKWYEISGKGRSALVMSEPGLLPMSSFVTRRVPSIYIAREILLHRHSDFLFNRDVGRSVLKKHYGYFLWDDQQKGQNSISKRLDFLLEYTRRVETMNLLVAEQFKRKLEKRNETLDIMKFGKKFFNTALVDYIKKGEAKRWLE